MLLVEHQRSGWLPDRKQRLGEGGCLVQVFFVRAVGGWARKRERARASRRRRLMDRTHPHPVVSQVSNRGRNFILQVADLMIQRVINGLIILMLNMASSNYTDLLSVKVWTPPPTQPPPPPSTPPPSTTPPSNHVLFWRWEGAVPAGRRTTRRRRSLKISRWKIFFILIFI